MNILVHPSAMLKVFPPESLRRATVRRLSLLCVSIYFAYYWLKVFTLAIHSARGRAVMARNALQVRAFLILPILLLLAAAPYPLVRSDLRSSITPSSAAMQVDSSPAKIIQMNDYMPMYRPGQTIITAGQTVEWQNEGQVSHSVVDNAREPAEPKDSLLPKGERAFSSGIIMPGATYHHRFTLPGRYRYFCLSHELDGMIGEIIVKPQRGDAVPVISREKSQS